MPVSTKTRFEVFKRDGFTCAYCGRKPPEVTLEADHIIPRAEGGGDEYENLITSCFDCNRGKGAGLLDDRAPVRDMGEQAEIIREREKQLRAYHAAKEEQVQRRETDFASAWNYWFEIWGAKELQKWHTPWENSLRSGVESIGVAEVKEAMDITRERFRYLTADAPRYFGGILKKKVAAAEGRVVQCKYCGKDIVLDRGDDHTRRWHHTQCRKEAEKA